ncbi:MAG: hypothetical protein LBM01_02070 [Christensenellaceae bacterium]|jgi:hypothetical protein|nr:hypothetical protein [Christensenellaceae bacterium]
MKGIIIGLVLITSLILAYKIYFKTKNKTQYFSEILRFLDFVSGEISFMKTDIISVVFKFEAKNFALKTDLKNFVAALQGGKLKDFKTFDDDFKVFLDNLGRADLIREQEKIEVAKKLFSAKLGEEEKYLATSAQSYSKLCIIIGVAVAIILV